jgi:hypothetical protein
MLADVVDEEDLPNGHVQVSARLAMRIQGEDEGVSYGKNIG